MATIVYIYHDGKANENSSIALSNDPVFNNNGEWRGLETCSEHVIFLSF